MRIIKDCADDVCSGLPPEKIVAFIRKHHVLTLATVAGGQPWCSNIFYAYIPQSNLFVFTSESHTRHAVEAVANSSVAGSIVLETRIVGRVQGLQLTGTTRPVATYDGGWTRKAYLKRFPYAAAMTLDLWILDPAYMKFTDNTLGFGKKIVWEKT